MKPIHFLFLFLLFLSVVSAGSCTLRSEFVVSSPDGNLKAVVKFDRDEGTLAYSVFSRDNEIILPGRLGINTDAGDFSAGVKLRKSTPGVVDETYSLPQGKVSEYHNHANEQILTVSKDKRS